MARFTILCVLIATLIGVYGQTLVQRTVQQARRERPELFMKAPQRAEKAGYHMDTHYVQTEDGYILGLHRIPGKEGSQPVLLQHGQFAMSDSWIAFGHSRSLAYQLSDRGYDVWLGNVRGTLYSRNHTTLRPSDTRFWKFSWHEMGKYDLAAIIDYILSTTGHSRLYYIGYSLGGRIALVLLSLRPEYNNKIRIVITMASLAVSAPGGDTNRNKSSNPIRDMKLFQRYLTMTGAHEMLPYSEDRIAMMYYMCTIHPVAMNVCRNIIKSMFGDSDGITNADVPMMTVMVMGGMSSSTNLHYAQIVESGKFQEFDYGPIENQKVYNSTHPKQYDLSKVTAPVAIHYGETDNRIREKDVKYMSTILPNVAEVRKVPASKFNHLDFISHPNVKELLYDHLVASMQMY